MRVQVFHIDHAYLPEHPVLKDITLDLAPGSLNYLIGPSGCGKSTLMRLLFGEEQLQTGQVLVGPWSLAHLTEKTRPYYRRDVGFVYQDLRLLPEWTAEENVCLPLEAIGRSRRAQLRRAHELLHQVGLGHHLRSPVAQLSGGERQRVAIARALVHNPRFLLADEPTANLDPKLSDGVIELLNEQRQRGVTLLITTHDHQLIKLFNSEVYEMLDGRISRHFSSRDMEAKIVSSRLPSSPQESKR